MATAHFVIKLIVKVITTILYLSISLSLSLSLFSLNTHAPLPPLQNIYLSTFTHHDHHYLYSRILILVCNLAVFFFILDPIDTWWPIQDASQNNWASYNALS
jgi:hypothetical protein